MEYGVIIPAYNEEKYIKYTLDSLVKQTIKPKFAIVVDDCSTDGTSDLINCYIKNHNWIKTIINTEKEKRASGAKVVRAFNLGYKQIDNKYDIIVKLDADLTLPNNYFEKVIEEFKKNETVGLVGGYVKNFINGKWIKERTASYHVRGAFKAYRKNAFENIGGFDEIMGWDGIDQMKLMYNGWSIKVLDIPVLHHRVTESASDVKNLNLRKGKSCYIRGYTLLLVLIRAIIHSIRKKNILPSYYFVLGFVNAYFNREKKVVDKNLEKFIKKFQYKRIIGLDL